MQPITKTIQLADNRTITIETGMKIVDFLDITLDLTKESYKPYKKPNSDLLYVNKQSSHPDTVLKHIPNSVNKRLITISSNSEVFDEAKGEYQRALGQSGYNQELLYPDNDDETPHVRNKKNRKRNIVWYNPPYNSSVITDFGRKFLKLIKKHFPPNHKLHPVINKNNVKLSYSTTKNMKRVIQNHNSKILRKNVTCDKEKTCSCPRSRKDSCPLENKCLTKSLVYKATVQESKKFYIGIAETNFKDRYTRHKHSFKNANNKNATTLSQHLWDIGQNITPTNPGPQIKWEILKKAEPRKPGSSVCQLCLEEKFQILKANKEPTCFNKRSELSMRCFVFHRAKHKLANV